MNISKITNVGSPTDDLKPKNVKSSRSSAASLKEDKLEISSEAASLFNASGVKSFDEIKDKIQSGFYFRRDVTEKVVDAILRDPTINTKS